MISLQLSFRVISQKLVLVNNNNSFQSKDLVLGLSSMNKSRVSIRTEPISRPAT